MLPLELHALEFEKLVERVRCEFRLGGLDIRSCEAVVDALVRCEFLQRTASGAVARVDG